MKGAPCSWRRAYSTVGKLGHEAGRGEAAAGGADSRLCAQEAFRSTAALRTARSLLTPLPPPAPEKGRKEEQDATTIHERERPPRPLTLSLSPLRSLLQRSGPKYELRYAQWSPNAPAQRREKTPFYLRKSTQVTFYTGWRYFCLTVFEIHWTAVKLFHIITCLKYTKCKYKYDVFSNLV